MAARSRSGALALAAVLAAVLAAIGALTLVSCTTQRWPAPMTQATDPLPAGSDSGQPGGIEDVLVVRHSDPVQVRRAGASGAFPMRFFAKRERVTSGAWIYCGAGGKAELIWPREGIAVILFDDGSARIGERERGEPAVSLLAVTRANLDVLPGTVIELPGGALFEGDPERRSGPFVLARIRPNVLRLKNQSKGIATVRFREETLRLSPGQVVDLPLVGAGTGPIPPASAPLRLERGSLDVALEGEVDVEDELPGLLIAADGPGRAFGRGVHVTLLRGERVRFFGLGEAPPAAAEAATALAPSPAAGPAVGPAPVSAPAPAPATPMPAPELPSGPPRTGASVGASPAEPPH